MLISIYLRQVTRVASAARSSNLHRTRRKTVVCEHLFRRHPASNLREERAPARQTGPAGTCEVECVIADMEEFTEHSGTADDRQDTCGHSHGNAGLSQGTAGRIP